MNKLLAPLLILVFAEIAMAGSDLPDIDKAWNFRDPAASEASFRKMVSEGEKAGDTAWTLEAKTQLARSLGLQQRFDEAHDVLDGVEAELTGDKPRLRARFLLERGRVLNSSGRPGDAIPRFKQAIEAANLAGDEYLAVDAAHMLGIVESPAAAIDWNERAIRMAESASDPAARRWLGPLYNNLAWTYNDRGEHEKALALFERDIAFREAQSQRFEASIATWSRAVTLRYLGRVEEALAVQQSLVDHPYRQGNAAEGYTHEEIGECLLALGRDAEARPHFAIALERLGSDEWLQANEPERLARLKQLAESSP